MSRVSEMATDAGSDAVMAPCQKTLSKSAMMGTGMQATDAALAARLSAGGPAREAVLRARPCALSSAAMACSEATKAVTMAT
jgi:hypothetical protein